jgi:hypothetical protein
MDLAERSMFMNHNPSSGSHPCRWKRWTPPAATVSAIGTSLAIWFEEIVTFVTEFIGVLILPILAGVIYHFNICVFKSANPTADDMKK